MGKLIEGLFMQDLEMLDWGLVEYEEAFLRQKSLMEERISAEVPDRLVLVEHPSVVTIGRSGGENDLRIPEDKLLKKGIKLYKSNRGGMATFHGPGQMVAYPVMKLKKRDSHLYVQTLQQVLATVLRKFGLKPELKTGRPGVWVGSAKIASIGIAVRKWVTYHGVALNVNTDLRCFDYIVPCGHLHEKITSMERELGYPPDMDEIKAEFIKAFGILFGYTISSLVQKKSAARPSWLTLPVSSTRAISSTEKILRKFQLATVCESAQCPNLGECFASNTATFMILGTECTRRCRFCAVDKGYPKDVDTLEPERVAKAVETLGLRYAVITSVTRDDLPDGGAEQFVRTINCIRNRCPNTLVEVLTPDFKGLLASLQEVFNARPDMFNHNIETVPRLYPIVRPKANYRRSLGILEYASKEGLPVKSGIMLGLGETDQEVREVLVDLRRAGCYYLTVGQYLAPSKDHITVDRFVPPEEFARWDQIARSLGFAEVASGSLVRSSYMAEKMVSPDRFMSPTS